MKMSYLIPYTWAEAQAALEAAITRPGVGWDEWFNSSATLWLTNQGGPSPVKGSPEPSEILAYGETRKAPASMRGLERVMAWETAMSGFTYTITPHDPASCRVVYEGAARGFGHQELLPQLFHHGYMAVVEEGFFADRLREEARVAPATLAAKYVAERDALRGAYPKELPELLEGLATALQVQRAAKALEHHLESIAQGHLGDCRVRPGNHGCIAVELWGAHALQLIEVFHRDGSSRWESFADRAPWSAEAQEDIKALFVA